MRISDWSSDVCSSDLAPLPMTAAGKSCGDVPHIASARQHRPREYQPQARRQARRKEIQLSPCPAGLTLVLAGGGGPDPTMVRPIGRASCRERVCQYV